MIAIIRSVGERTTQPLLQQMRGQSDKVALVQNVTPFSEALRQSFLIAIESGQEYVMCIDADVTPTIDLPMRCAAALDRAPGAYAAVPRMVDYLQGKTRAVGVHAYRVSMLSEALERISEFAGTERPESKLRKVMGRSVRVENGGVHGKGQYYRDIYRTVLLWPAKHKKHEARLHKYWLDNAGNHDYRVALRAWEDGERMNVRTCDASIDTDFERVLDELGLTEKVPL